MTLRTIIERLLNLGGYACSDTHRLLFDYVQGELSPETRRKLERHLAGCKPCERYLLSYQHAIRATHDHARPELEMPAELHRRLKEFIAQNPDLR